MSLALDEHAFVEAMTAGDVHRKRVASWRRKALTHDHSGSAGRCLYCGTGIGAPGQGRSVWVMDHLVPVVAGGFDDHSALVPACKACYLEKGSRDWLLFGKAVAPDVLQRQRLEVLRRSLNHLMPDPSVAWTKLQVQRVLNERWRYPRSAFFAACTQDTGLIGARPGGGTGEEVAAVLSLFASKAVADGPHAGFRLWRIPPTRFLEVVWQLIELNSYVQRLDLGEKFPDTTPQDNPELARWSETHWNLGEIVLRRDYRKRDDWHPNRRYPRREPGAPEYQKPVKNPRQPKPKMTPEEIKAKVDAMMQDSHPLPLRMLGPRARALEEQRDKYDRLLLDLGFRILAYSLLGEEMPWDEPCRYRYIGKNGEVLSKPTKRRKPVKRLTPRQRRERRAAALAAGLPPPKRAWP